MVTDPPTGTTGTRPRRYKPHILLLHLFMHFASFTAKITNELYSYRFTNNCYECLNDSVCYYLQKKALSSETTGIPTANEFMVLRGGDSEAEQAFASSEQLALAYKLHCLVSVCQYVCPDEMHLRLPNLPVLFSA